MKHEEIVDSVRADLEAAYSLVWNIFFKTYQGKPEPEHVARVAELIGAERRYQEGKTGQTISPSRPEGDKAI